ncbi:rRNA maturation RNase YbeY [Auritidibacter ignavus]|uniref:rRNA maturation RNase YbeY n=1 Tax=Auritidibacter ignavus TaxID=678932 RepID=UPI00244D7308|nr:rRNA maturation RNase YbeY [Auritidibacter ignavus]WGH82186.1 rRNA maturation RNase YbeY [Auritidibacter ignavus]WGH91365.1 rRNA maturation RNase YbeY [Auritidibacter ignavus]WHS27872.1 rRNA maturation RNase YbeY [Auritidibacter ignavus]
MSVADVLPHVDVLNESQTPVDTDRLYHLIQHLFTALHLAETTELSVVCVDPGPMEQLHLDWMDLPGPTDVMSFPMDGMTPGTAEEPNDGVLGDVVLCPVVAADQARAGGHETADEMALLLTHGVLHLLGYDHQDPAAREEMFTLQDRLLTAFLGYPAPAPTVD